MTIKLSCYGELLVTAFFFFFFFDWIMIWRIKNRRRYLPLGGRLFSLSFRWCFSETSNVVGPHTRTEISQQLLGRIVTAYHTDINSPQRMDSAPGGVPLTSSTQPPPCYFHVGTIPTFHFMINRFGANTCFSLFSLFSFVSSDLLGVFFFREHGC